MRFCRDLAIGIPIVFVGTVILTGSVQNAGVLFLISVVCTAGLGLLFWLPLCWFAGFLVTMTIGAALKQPDWQSGEAATTTAVKRGKQGSRHSDLEAVCRYIRECQARGMPEREINETLLSNGWSGTIIAQAWETQAWEVLDGRK